VRAGREPGCAGMGRRNNRHCATLTHLDVEELSLKFYLRATSTGGFSRGFVISSRLHGLILLLLVVGEVIPVILFEILRGRR
jgi:hypothetical protein